jgi:hypothetical protein
MALADLDCRVGKGAQTGTPHELPVMRLCPRAYTGAFFVNVGKALHRTLGEGFISVPASAHPTRCALSLSAMMELS